VPDQFLLIIKKVITQCNLHIYVQIFFSVQYLDAIELAGKAVHISKKAAHDCWTISNMDACKIISLNHW